MTTTQHYQLLKPQPADFYDIDDFNANSDAIDSALFHLSNRADFSEDALNAVGLKQKVFNAEGIYIFSAPRAGSYVVECVGGGGGCTIGTSSNGSIRGGGGAYARSSVTLAANQNVEVTVGERGFTRRQNAGGATVGGASSFGSFVTAPGGVVDYIHSVTPANTPASGDIRIPGFHSYIDNSTSSSYSRAISGYSMYSAPTIYESGPAASTWGNPGAGAGLGAVHLNSVLRTYEAEPGMVIVTYVE